MKYYIQNRYQDGGWESNDAVYAEPEDAFRRAWDMAGYPIQYGMVRVVDAAGNVLVTYSAGENRHHTPLPLSDELESATQTHRFNEHLKRASQQVSMWDKDIQTVLGGQAHSMISPNGAEPGSLVYAAEEWMLKKGLTIPVAGKFRHLFQGMLDDFQESKEYEEWGRS